MASRVYKTAVTLRSFAYQKGWRRIGKLPVPVISVGNITAGGTGKTPMVQWLARYLQEKENRPAVLSRGYAGRRERTGGVAGDGRCALLDPKEAGDEAFLMARNLPGVPVMVGADRYRSGLKAVRDFGADILILDDGFQHIRLARDLDIVMLDARRPFGNGHLLPRGTLREAPDALARAHAVVLTRCSSANLEQHPLFDTLTAGKPVFKSSHLMFIQQWDTENADNQTHSLNDLQHYRNLAFSGLGRNRLFFKALRQAGVPLIQTVSFPDHHWYETSDLKAVAEQCRADNVDRLVTTAKDFVRIPKGFAWPVPLTVVDVSLGFEKENEIRRFLDLTCRALFGKNHPV